ncbi:hypothetical protein F5879DRAFT_927933 [Lentinula edodes]|nr:hypothetical protein F5879DRAFT_927933 [Lentinula edodes]
MALLASRELPTRHSSSIPPSPSSSLERGIIGIDLKEGEAVGFQYSVGNSNSNEDHFGTVAFLIHGIIRKTTRMLVIGGNPSDDSDHGKPYHSADALPEPPIIISQLKDGSAIAHVTGWLRRRAIPMPTLGLIYRIPSMMLIRGRRLIDGGRRARYIRIGGRSGVNIRQLGGGVAPARTVRVISGRSISKTRMALLSSDQPVAKVRDEQDKKNTGAGTENEVFLRPLPESDW